MNRTIEIKKRTLLNLLLSVGMGYCILFGIEHLGKFTFMMSSDGGNGTEVASINYKTYFGNSIETGGNGFTNGDLMYMNSPGSDFGKYPTKVFYFTEATKKDYIYGLLFSGVIFSIFLFSSNFKIKLS